MNPISNILHKVFNEDKLNILTGPTHEAFETMLCKTGHNFYAFQHPSFKKWVSTFREPPVNYHILPEGSLPLHVQFDVALSQNKFGQYQILSDLSNKLHIPLISLEHTLPMPNWPNGQLEAMNSMRGNWNVFITDMQKPAWKWECRNDTQVITHAIDTDTFKPGNQQRKNIILTVANDYIGRDWCTPAGTKILTSLGYIPIEKIVIGDKVLSDDGIFNTVVDTQKREYFGPMVFIKLHTQRKEFAFTSNHEIRVHRDGNWKYIEAGRLRKGDILRFPKLIQTEFYETSEKLAYLIGNIIGDGSITKKGSIEIICNKNELNKANKLLEIIKEYISGATIKITVPKIQGNEITYKVCAKSLIFANWLRDKIGKKSHQKHIPEFIFNASDKVKLAILQGLWSCDGSFKNGQDNERLCYSTISTKLASQVSALLHHFGISCYIRRENRITNKSNGTDVWIYRIVSACKENTEKCIKLINESIINESYSYIIGDVRIEEEWRGTVYNCTVNNDPSYVVYPGFVSHNCLGFSQYKRVTEGLPTLPVGDTKGLSKAAKDVNELVGFYQTSRIFLNTAHISPVPMSLLEAMSCGCAAVSVRASAIPEFIQHGVTGFLYDTDKEARYYLELLLKDKDLACELGNNAVEYIKKKCSLDKFLEQWNEIFNKSKQMYHGQV